MIRFLSPLAICLTASTALAQLPCIDPNLGTQLQLSDDAFSSPLSLGFTFNFDGVAYTEVQVCSNGYVVFGSGSPGSPDWSPTIAELLNNPEPRVCPIWRDLNPAATNSGQVWYNAVAASGGNPAYFSVTYDGVFQFGTSTAITAQILFIDGDSMQIAYDANVQNGTNTWLVGASPGNGAAANPVSFTTLPIVTGGNATLHEDGTGGFAVGQSVIQWTADGSGGYVVTQNSSCAYKQTYGEGCTAAFSTIYEHFDVIGNFDLSNTAITGLSTGSGYVMTQGLTTFMQPSGTATNLSLGDDATAVVTLSQPFNYPGGSTMSLEVCSNGFVSVGNNGAPYNPMPSAMLNWSFPAWTVWHDFTPTATNNVWAEEVNGVLYVTWLNVGSYTQLSAQSTFQFQFDLVTGFFHIVFQNMFLGPTTWIEDYIVGYTPANGAGDPGSQDLTPIVSGGQTVNLPGADTFPLSLDVDANPVVGTTINMLVDNITATAPVGGILFGLARYQPGINLTPFGMPDCYQYNDQLAVVLFFPAGATNLAVPFGVPPTAVGVQFQLQAAVYDPVSAINNFATSSNGVELGMGN